MSSREQSSAAFTGYYMQQATKEFAEDLDKIRTADDFKGDALPLLINSLRQGTSMFTPADQKRVVDAAEKEAAASEDSEA